MKRTVQQTNNRLVVTVFVYSSSSSPITCSGPPGLSAFGTREYHLLRGVIAMLFLESSFTGALRPVVAYRCITYTMSA